MRKKSIAALILAGCMLAISYAGAAEDLKETKPVVPPGKGAQAADHDSSGNYFGYAPPPWDQSEIFSAAGEGKTLRRRSYPVSYVLPHVTEPKDQGACGTCWIFAATGSIEAKVHDDTAGTASPDYSEQNVKNCHADDEGGDRCAAGGNAYMATAYLGLYGAVDEPCDPYSTTQNTVCQSGCPALAVPQQWEIISADTQASVDDIEYALTTCHAPVYTAMYATGLAYNPGAAALCGTTTAQVNHAVLIVGWDDAYPAAGACSPGAWLVKNSWGDDWGDGGYFRIAYNQLRIGEWSSVYSHYRMPYTAERIYHHDVGGVGYSLGYEKTNYGAALFTADQNEVLRRVEFMTSKPDSSYEIKLFANWNGTGAAPTGQLGSTVTGSITSPGLYSIELAGPVSIAAGSTLVVQVKTYTPDGSGYGFYYDYGQRPGAPGASFFSYSGSSWVDSSSYNGGVGPAIIHAVAGEIINDADQDGIEDPVDNCPATANPDQGDGDMDGIGSACDNCPETCNSQQLDADVDGAGDVCDTSPGCGGCGQPACEQECISGPQGAAVLHLKIAGIVYNGSNSLNCLTLYSSATVSGSTVSSFF